MKPKVTIDCVSLPGDKDTQLFLCAFERCNRSEIPDKMWNKLYAILCKARDRAGGINYKIYRGARYDYDVTTRNSWPIVSDDETMCVANIMEGKKRAVKN